jgi:glycosyltransferase involved in cell wall biosynthesis
VSKPRSNIEVLIIARDEAANIPHALRSVLHWADCVHVVDSGSLDATREIAREMGAVVTEQAWLGYAKQKNWALDNLPWKSDWIFILDADEVVLPELREELLRIAALPQQEVPESGFFVNRYFIFLGKRIRHCGYYPSWNLRFFKRGRARYEDRQVHEHMLVDGPSGYLQGHMEHYDRRGLEVYTAKHNRYSTLEAEEIARHVLGQSKTTFKASLLGDPLERNRWIKHHLYPRLPAKWLMRFCYMYFLRLGALDGVTGFRFCMFISSYELMVGLKLEELLQAAREGSNQ